MHGSRIAGCLTALAPCLLGALTAALPGGQVRPNVLVVVLDDVGHDKFARFDFLDASPYARTPCLSRLADEGIQFRNFYVDPICSTTRALVLTGRYAFRTGMGTNTEVYRLPDSELLLPELLRFGFPPGAGYRCGAFGKWHIGASDPAHAVTNGFHLFHGSLGNDGDHFAWPKVEHAEGAPVSGPTTVARYSPTVVREDAVAWIQAQTGPFFAWVAFNPPHAEWQVPPLDLLSPETRAELAGYSEGQVAVGNDERKLFFRAMLESVDTEIQNLLDGIGPAILAETMVFVVCDNGTTSRVVQPPHDPSHGKPSLFDLSVRVPLIVWGPYVPQPVPAGGHVVTELVEAVDLWPTIAALTGADADLAFQTAGMPVPRMDGESVLPLILDPSAPGPNELAFSELFAPAGPYQSTQCLRVHARAITNGEYKYIRWVDKTGGPPCALPHYTHELYDLVTDPGEQVNLLQGTLTPLQRSLLEHLRTEMDHLSSAPGHIRR